MEIKVDLFAELDRAGLPYEFNESQPWVSVKCPFHDDKTPSCAIHTQGQYFKCHACGAGGDFAHFMARYIGVARYVIVADWHKRYGASGNDTPVNSDIVEQYHESIWKAGPLRLELYSRGITDEDIRLYRLGEHDARITVPIPNENGVWVNILKYRPGAAKYKVTNLKGRGKPRLFPHSQLEHPSILICGGFLKAIAAARQLNKHGIGCVASTGGEDEKNFPREYLKLISGREKVWVCLDIDKTGQRETKRLAAMLAPINNWVGTVLLPLDPDKYPKGDVSDYIGKEKGDLWPLLQTAPKFEPTTLDLAPELYNEDEQAQPENVSIVAASKADRANTRLAYRGLVASIESESFFVPRTVRVYCDRQQELCANCPIFPLEDGVTAQISPESDALLEIINAAKKNLNGAIKHGLGIPPCKSARFEIKDHYNANHAIITQDLDSGDVNQSVQLPGVSIDCEIEINETYDIVGKVVPHPNTQRATAILSHVSPVKDTLGAASIDYDKIDCFKPADWTVQAIQRKLDSIYADFEANVTRIYERRELHTLVDLAYHSCLYFYADGRSVKGWVEVLAIGDSSQGKTETAVNIAKHYGLGQKVDCKNASAAGLLGGVQSINGRYYVSWGAMPINDRRLLILEELKGAHPDVIAKLTDARSSGIAEIPKIERKKARCRCRLIALSNSRSGLDLMAYNYGIEAIRELVPNLEDIRRFDTICCLSKQDIELDIMQFSEIPGEETTSEPTYSSDSCRAAVLWGWTRSAKQIKFENWQTILTHAKQLVSDYVESVPIVDRGSIRFKLARLAIALAVRTFSHADDNKDCVLVRDCHIEWVSQYLRQLYNSKGFGYDRFSKAVRSDNNMRQPEAVLRKLHELPFPADFAECALQTTKIEVRDICDWCGWERIEATEFVSMLVRNRAIVRDGNGYHKTPSFIAMLNEALRDPKFTRAREVPNYVKGQL